MIMISTHTMMRVGRNPVLILFFSKTITYSSVPNRRACTFINFEKKFPPARPYFGLHV